MSAASASASWPANGPGSSSAHVPARQWVLARNCSITPRQLGAVYLSLCTVSAVISAGFWWHGAPFVGAFAGVELLALGAALVVHARHAGDRDVVTLTGDRLAVARHAGGRIEQHEFPAAQASVQPPSGAAALVALSGRGRSVEVGRHVRPASRAAFASELAAELRSALRQNTH